MIFASAICWCGNADAGEGNLSKCKIGEDTSITTSCTKFLLRIIIIIFVCSDAAIVVMWSWCHVYTIKGFHFPEWLIHYLPPCSRPTMKMPILTRLSSRRASEETEPPAYSELYSRDDSVMDRIVVSWIVNIICFSHKVNQIIIPKKVAIRID